MTKSVKNSLTLILILSLAILPLRIAFAMPINAGMHDSTNVSDNHCANMKMSTTETSVTDSSDTITKTTDNNCCGIDGGDCSSCMNNVAAITTELNLKNDLPSLTEADFPITSVQPQVQAPPFRPPQTTRI